MDFTEETNSAYACTRRAVLAKIATIWPQTILHQERPKNTDQVVARNSQSLQTKKMEATYIQKAEKI